MTGESTLKALLRVASEEVVVGKLVLKPVCAAGDVWLAELAGLWIVVGPDRCRTAVGEETEASLALPALFGGPSLTRLCWAVVVNVPLGAGVVYTMLH